MVMTKQMTHLFNPDWSKNSRIFTSFLVKYEQLKKLKKFQTLTVNKLTLLDTNSNTMPTHYTLISQTQKYIRQERKQRNIN